VAPQVGFARERWTAPLDVRHVHPNENANAVAVEQVARLVRRLPPDGPVPLVVCDAGLPTDARPSWCGGAPVGVSTAPSVAPPRPQGGQPMSPQRPLR